MNISIKILEYLEFKLKNKQCSLKIKIKLVLTML